MRRRRGRSASHADNGGTRAIWSTGTTPNRNAGTIGIAAVYAHRPPRIPALSIANATTTPVASMPIQGQADAGWRRTKAMKGIATAIVTATSKRAAREHGRSVAQKDRPPIPWKSGIWAISHDRFRTKATAAHRAQLIDPRADTAGSIPRG